MAKVAGAVGLISGQYRAELEALADALPAAPGETPGHDADCVAAALVEQCLASLRQFQVLPDGTRIDVVMRAACGKLRR